MNKERLLYRFVQREILSTFHSSPHLPLSLAASGVPHQLLSPSRFQKLPHASGLPHQLMSPSRFSPPDASLSLTVLSLALVISITFASYKK